ncbi:MAG TPA: hypothetical protein DGG95_01650 [Cytophagales bacterium]|nr:hypothetical protein [Cytophagales bacterium]
MAKIVEEVPSNDKVRKPTPKKTFNLDNFKKKSGTQDIPSKPLTWIPIDVGLKQATGMPGVPKGYVTLFRGYSNTGKSTAVMRAIVNAQRMGDLPIIIDTENNIDIGNQRLTLMGFDWNKPYILVNNKFLLENFGKKQDKNRNEASIEDLAKAMYYFLDQQAAGELPIDIFFGIDSIGTLNCIKTINASEKDETQNNMWNAGAYEKAFMYLLNNTIPSSRKINKPHTNTVVATQKIWIDNMNKGVVKHKGGETWNLGARLIFHMGGIITHGTKAATADSKKRTVSYGVETKISVAKNHIDGPLGGISMQGTIISTPLGFVYPDDIEAFKKKNILYFRNLFEDDSINAEDLTLSTKNIDANGKISFEDEVIQRVEVEEKPEE